MCYLIQEHLLSMYQLIVGRMLQMCWRKELKRCFKMLGMSIKGKFVIRIRVIVDWKCNVHKPNKQFN